MSDRCVNCGAKYGLEKCRGQWRCWVCRTMLGLVPDTPEGDTDDT